MAETLVIEWDRDRLIVATGSSTVGKVQFASAAVVDRAGGNLNPMELGEELRSTLAAGGIAASEAIVLFPRQLVTFHRLTLPNLHDDELPEMVALQAATRLTAPVESVLLDFVPLPGESSSETRDVLLVTLPKKHVTDVSDMLRVCNIALAGVRVSSFGIAAASIQGGLISESADSTQVDAIVAMGTDSIEMIFMTGRSVAFSHSGASWTSDDAVEQAVRSEISRARMAATEDMGDYVVRRLTLIGSSAATSAVPDSVSKRLNDAEVVRIDPDDNLLSCQLPVDLSASDLVGIAGTIANSGRTTVESVDLANPRKPPEKKDYSRVRNLAIAGIIVLALVGSWKWRSNKVKSFASQTSTLKADTESLKSQFKAAKNELKLNDRLQEWSDRKIDLLGQMQKLQQLMEGADRIYFESLSFRLRKGEQAGAIQIDGHAKDREDIEDFSRTLNHAGYDVTPSEIPASLDDSDYAFEMSLEVTIPVSVSTSNENATS